MVMMMMMMVMMMMTILSVAVSSLTLGITYVTFVSGSHLVPKYP